MHFQLLSMNVASTIQVRSWVSSSKLTHSWASRGTEVTVKTYPLPLAQAPVDWFHDFGNLL